MQKIAEGEEHGREKMDEGEEEQCLRVTGSRRLRVREGRWMKNEREEIADGES